MTQTTRSGLIRTIALAVALVGAMLFGTPRSAQAAPAIVSAEVAGPVGGLTTVQYGGGHWRHHGGHHGRHFGHHRGRHFGHHYGRRHGHHFGRHFGHHRGHHYGRRHFY